MLLVHVPRLNNRIGYTLNVLLGNLLHCPFEITTDAEIFLAHPGPRLNYGPERLATETVWVKSTQLLFQSSIKDIELPVGQCDDIPTLFPVYGHELDFNFDLLAATFYMVSRYEEYLPHRKDAHGRFCHTDSLAYRAGFLQRPVVDLWANLLRCQLEQRFPNHPLPQRHFVFEPTVDIDAAFCYRGKGFWRSVIGFSRDLFGAHDTYAALHRWRVLRGKEEDPFNTFDFLLDLKSRHPKADLLFFALMADYGPYDKSISHHSREFCQLLKHLADYVKVGIHTSYASYDEPARIDMEMKRLHNVLHHPIVRNRAHFLRLSLPHTYRELLRHGIRHDYTMGYADHPGFRAGISVPYPFYDLEQNTETQLIIHPFCLMDVTLHKTLQMSNSESLDLFCRMIDDVASVQGTFSAIFHNQYLCDLFGWQGWRDTFARIWEYGASKNL